MLSQSNLNCFKRTQSLREIPFVFLWKKKSEFSEHLIIGSDGLTKRATKISLR